jgi:hypothetical protein
LLNIPTFGFRQSYKIEYGRFERVDSNTFSEWALAGGYKIIHF